MASEHAGARDISPDAIRQQYGLTRAETRLALSLAEGNSVRQAAQSMGIGYGTARVYLKSVFGKTDAHTQAQLVARILVDAHTRDIRHDAGHAVDPQPVERARANYRDPAESTIASKSVTPGSTPACISKVVAWPR